MPQGKKRYYVLWNADQDFPRVLAVYAEDQYKAAVTECNKRWGRILAGPFVLGQVGIVEEKGE